MALSAFSDKSKKPKKKALQDVLGRSWGSWQELTEWLAGRHRPTTEEWVYGGGQWGWSLRLKHKKRAILYMTPCEKHFMVGFMLGEKAAAAALQMDLPKHVAEGIRTAKRYAEGRAVRLEIRYKKDLAAVKLLADAKMAH